MSQNFPLDQRVVHVSGACACGKSTLANRIRNEFTTEEVAVLDVDDFVSTHTDEGKKLSMISDEEQYTNEFMKVLKKTSIEYLQKNRRAKLIVLVGFFDYFTLQKAEFANYMAALAHERYYMHIEMTSLIDRYSQRVRTLLKQHKWLSEEISGKSVDYMKSDEILHYEVELWTLHRNLEFIRANESLIFQRIQYLSGKLDKSKTVTLCYRDKKTGAVSKAVLMFRQTDKLSDEVVIAVENLETKKSSLKKRLPYFPVAQAEKIWMQAYRMNREGVFNYKSQPHQGDWIQYDNHYGSGADITPLLELFLICLE